MESSSPDLKSGHTNTTPACAHCGDPCKDEHIAENELNFCCPGCQSVYHLLSESGLGSYYRLEETPGINMKGEATQRRFEHLDDPEISRKLLDFYDGKIAKVRFRTPQIHCSSCIWLLENLFKLEPAVMYSEVFFGRQEVDITYDPNNLKLSELAALLTRIGYRPEEHLGRLDKNEKDTSLRPLYLKIGVAGFAFGNIMLFSLPEYLAGSEGIDQQFIHLFGMLNIALALPVFFYSSLDFYRSAWLGIRQKQWNMDIAISLGIMAMFFRSLYEILSGYGVGYMDSFAMLVFLLLVGRLFQKKTYETLSFDRDYKSYFPLSVLKLTDGEEQSIPATNLEVNDEILIRSGELVPADSVLLDKSARIDYSFVTGESDPVEMNKGDWIYAGGRLYGTASRFQVEKPVSKSYLTSLWNHDAFSGNQEEGLRSASQRFSRYFSPTVIGIALLSAMYWLPTNPAAAVNAFSAVLIIACPCALALSAPFTLGWATNILGRNKCYLKNSDVVEQLAGTDAVVFDKTGTLTMADAAEVSYSGKSLDQQTVIRLRSVLHNSTHPLSRKVYRHLTQQEDGRLRPVSNFTETPGRGLEATVEEWEVRIGSADWAGFEAHTEPEESPDSSRVYVALDGQPVGWFNVRSAYRDGLQSLFTGLKRNVRSFLLSGDNEKERHRLSALFPKQSELYFRQSPEDKLRFIEKLKEEGARVTMVGDGLNDAGALKSSHVGISITEDAAGFTPASDVIMEAGMLPNLDKYIAFSRGSIRIIYISFAISILYNIIGLSYAVTATLSPLICAIIMPVSSISVILYTTLATNFNAKRLGLKAWQ